ncbi:MAG: AMP-dependent synthetase [Opitutaceae bacterium]|nr:AMP-dependent synthetase [Opitutaceae bacterium]
MAARPLSSPELIRLGLNPERSAELAALIEHDLGRNRRRECWDRVSRDWLRPQHPFELHRTLYCHIYGEREAFGANAPAWIPTPKEIQGSNLHRLLTERKLADYGELHRWSITHREEFWASVLQLLHIQLDHPYSRMLDSSEGVSRARWLVDARMNIVRSCFSNAPTQAPAVIYRRCNGATQTVSYGELRTLVNRVSSGLVERGLQKGDGVAINTPMTLQAVAFYLGIVQAGGVVVSIADSFAAEEIATRLRAIPAKFIFTQDVVARGGKRLPLYEKVVAARGPTAIVFGVDGRSSVALRSGDLPWDQFLSSIETFEPVSCHPHDTMNVLFSSGTTAEPKAIPLDHATVIKNASDGYFYQDVQPGTVVCWPTNMGWLMGLWVVSASLINGGTMALYEDTPVEAGFGRFLQEARVNVLGVIPSFVRSWRQSRCMDQFDWSAIKAFSSTGECSNPEDMLWLMSRAGYKPMIEYCGGTEIGGGYINGTVIHPCVPSAFPAPALGLDFVILDESERPADHGELFLIGPALGLSRRLLNGDHEEVYYRGTPRDEHGNPLRRHGDEVERLAKDCYRVLGRADDTMNLGGIKVGSAEIERVLNLQGGIKETAAVAVPPPGGGPSRLIIFTVIEPGATASVESLRVALQQTIKAQLNPLFKIHEVRVLDSLPRTATNKVMRRELRAAYLKGLG